MARKKKAAPAETEARIVEARKGIDRADSQILALLNKRAALAREIGDLKKQRSQLFYLPGREEEIFERLSRLNAGPFPTDSIRPVFREIISACRSLEKRLRVAFFGLEGSFTHIAGRQQFGHSAEFISERTVTDVFETVARGHADYGVVPIENSTEGVVTHTLDMFLDSELTICAEVVLEIRHFLLSVDGDLKSIKRVYSHPQAIAQCRNWLRKNLPGINVHETASTSEAARMAAVDRDAAAIASELAGDNYHLKTVARSIEDLTNNFTRFLVIGRVMGPKSGRDTTAIVFSVKDRPGVLFDALGHFARRGLNLSKIESRPLRGRAWEYIFFAEMDGHISDDNVRDSLRDLQQDCVFVKVLGSFPKMRKDHQNLGV